MGEVGELQTDDLRDAVGGCILWQRRVPGGRLSERWSGRRDLRKPSMNETEWEASADPAAMLAAVNFPANARKLRLFAVALYRRLCRPTTDAWQRECEHAIRVAVRAADGAVNQGKLARVNEAFIRQFDLAWSGFFGGAVDWHGNASFDRAELERWALFDLVDVATQPDAGDVAGAVQVLTELADRIAINEQLLSGTPPQGDDEPDESFAARILGSEVARGHQTRIAAELCELFRELFGNPFRPVAVGALTSAENVRALAGPIYEKERFADLPVLADALEDAGCANADLLRHLRQPDGHVRGCWALDAVLDAVAAEGEWAPSRPRHKRRRRSAD